MQKTAVCIGSRAPANRVQERFEFRRVVLAGDSGQPGAFDNVRTGFDFPDDFELLAEAVLVDRG